MTLPSSRQKHKITPTDIKSGFDRGLITLQLSQIAPLKIVLPQVFTSRKFEQIFTSMREVGIIEPPVVVRDGQSKDKYILLDGHLRLEALKKLASTEVTCLISADNESFTYNKHINRLSPVQEHKMILRAIKRGVPEEKIAKALGFEASRIKEWRNLVNGICPEAVDLLKDKMVPVKTFHVLRQMKPERQIDAARLMNSANSYSHPYAKALLAGTPKNQLVTDKKGNHLKGLSYEQMDKMETEMVNVQREFKLIEETYNQDVFTLVLVKGYIGRMMHNARIIRHLAQHHSDILTQFQQISEMTTLKGKEMAAA